MARTEAQGDAHLLSLLQAGFPLTGRPYDAIGRRLGTSGRQVMQRVRALKRKGVIRHIGGMLDSEALGYESSLVAMRCPERRIAEIAAIVSRHPGVSHNYRRTHAFNLWFTIAVPPGRDLHEEVSKLVRRAKPLAAIVLPSLRKFKLRVVLPVAADPAGLPGESSSQPGVILSEAKNLAVSRRERCLAVLGRTKKGAKEGVTAADADAARELQRDLPVRERPFAAAARRLGVSEETFLRRARGLVRKGVMRRFGAVLHHRRAGFVANCMAVWAVPSQRIARAGRIAAESPNVSHCYERPSRRGWPYTLFAMIHGRSKAECRRVADAISKRIGKPRRALLFSVKEYKKTRPVYAPRA